MQVRVFEVNDPESLQPKIDEWLRYTDIVVRSVSQSECAAGENFYHITVIILYDD